MLRFQSSNYKEDIEFHEILLDKLAQKKEEEVAGVSEKKIEVPLLRKILQGFLFFVFLLFLAFFGKTFQLQIIQGERFSSLAEENKFIIHQIQAERGVIYDQFLNQLVFNRPSFDLVCEGEIIAEDLDHQALILYEIRINEMPGCEIRNNSVRYYQNGAMFSHLIGYTGKITAEELREREGSSIFDWVGRKGVERYYEDVLRKNPGEIRVKKDAFGNIISKEVISLPEHGDSLILWLDSDLQKKITEELKKSIETVGSKAGIAVALDPKTGGVLALVSYPNFDNNLFQGAGSPAELKHLLEGASGVKPLFNRAISGRYVPGSTIKPFITAAALEEGLIDSETQIFSDGRIEIPHEYDPDIVFTFRDAQPYGHGWTDAKKAIADSVNTFFYAIGGGYKDQKGMGPHKMKEYLRAFGWGQRTGIDIPGESKGLLPSPEWRRAAKGEQWWKGHTYLFAIGQGDVLITPLQLAVSTLAIANDGVLLEPQVAKKVYPSVINKDFIFPENLQIIKQGMRQAVTDGTAKMLNYLPVKTAAKTGTAETPIKEHYHHWVAVFAPYDDPQIVLVIMIENIEGIRAATLPAAKAILDWYFREK